MCGLAGIMFGEGTRSAQELRRLRQLFTEPLVVSRRRGPHATGITWINRDGEHRLFKRPISRRRSWSTRPSQTFSPVSTIEPRYSWDTRVGARKETNTSIATIIRFGLQT
jgi:hypothetical protein